jgi:hypothetical protein
MAEAETQALTLKQVRAKRRLEWMAENTQRQNDNIKSSKNFQEIGDVHGHSLWAKKQFEDTQSRLC